MIGKTFDVSLIFIGNRRMPFTEIFSGFMDNLSIISGSNMVLQGQYISGLNSVWLSQTPNKFDRDKTHQQHICYDFNSFVICVYNCRPMSYRWCLHENHVIYQKLNAYHFVKCYDTAGFGMLLYIVRSTSKHLSKFYLSFFFQMKSMHVGCFIWKVKSVIIISN